MNKHGENDMLGFITMEDITHCKEDHNYVVWNYGFPIEYRIKEFKRIMKYKFNHFFYKKEMDYIIKDDSPMRASEFIRRVRNILFHDYSV